MLKNPTPGLVGFEKVTPNTSNKSNEGEDDEDGDENAKDNSPVPPLAKSGVIATAFCVCEMKREDLPNKAIFYNLQGDISKREDMEWKLSDIHYPLD